MKKRVTFATWSDGNGGTFSCGDIVSVAPIVCAVPIKLVNPLNRREHWRSVAKRGRAEKALVMMVLGPLYRGTLKPCRMTATITRIAKRRFDTDGMVASAKHTRDSIAFIVGVDDGDEAFWTWNYEQRTGPAYGVEIRLEAR